MPNPISLRLFLSSPGDVSAERGKVRAVVNEINHDPMYKDKVTIEVIAWDDPHSDVVMPVTLTPQQAIDLGMPRPSECDICITILWGRMGTPLDTDAHGAKADGTPYLSGTEWEYLDAVKGAKGLGTGFPIVYLYRRTDDVPDPKLRPGQTKADAYIEHGTQMKRVEDFFNPLRDPVSGAMRGFYHEYAGIDAFVELIERHVRTLAKHVYEKKLGVRAIPTKIDDTVPLPLRWDIDKDGSPFPGLRVFTEKYKPVFFGRSREVAQVIRRMATQRLLVIVGASGSGKSSLVRAGVLPTLGENALPPSANWLRLTMRPTARPFLALAETLVTQVPPFAGDPDIMFIERCETLAASLRNDSSELMRRLATAYAGQPYAEIVLFVDQAEELFTLARPDDVQVFLAMLKQPSEHLRVLLTIRSDFYDKLLPHLEEELRETTYTLAKPSPLALLEMITRPAEVAGLEFDDDLPETIVRETGSEAGSLALMAYALDELYQTSHADKRLTFTAYQAIGGVEGAIGKRAENVFEHLAMPDKERLLQRVFCELLTVDDRGTATRQQAVLNQFAKDEQALIHAFVVARLLVMQEDSVEMAHEAVFRSWERLKDWIAVSQEDLILLRQVRAATDDWTRHTHQDAFRWPAERLKPVYEMIERQQPTLGDNERNFIEPEQNRLLKEIEQISTGHKRRRWIGERLATIGDMRFGIGLDERGLPEIDWLPVTPGGEIDIEGKKFTVQPFYIAKYLITYRQFQAFLDAPDGFANEQWWEGMPIIGRKQTLPVAVTQYDNYPRGSLSWYHCVAFARWLDYKYREHRVFRQFTLRQDQQIPLAQGRSNPELNSVWQLRVPTEWEWHWAAQGGKASLEYPWGAWDNFARANTSEAGIGDRFSAVGMFPHGAALCGAHDMAGNLWEWCLNNFNDILVIDINNVEEKTLKGGSYIGNREFHKTAHRGKKKPDEWNRAYGMRLVCADFISF